MDRDLAFASQAQSNPGHHVRRRSYFGVKLFSALASRCEESEKSVLGLLLELPLVDRRWLALLRADPLCVHRKCLLQELAEASQVDPAAGLAQTAVEQNTACCSHNMFAAATHCAWGTGNSLSDWAWAALAWAAEDPASASVSAA